MSLLEYPETDKLPGRDARVAALLPDTAPFVVDTL
jgi:hypothetical protein